MIRRKSVISEKQTLIFALQTENEELKKEVNRMLGCRKQASEVKVGKYSDNEVKDILEQNHELEKELKRKKEELQNIINQNLYLKENNQNLATELKTAKYQLLSAKRSQFISSRTKSEIDLKLETEKNVNYKKKISDLKSDIKENKEKINQLDEQKFQLNEEIKQVNNSLLKHKENESFLNEKTKYLEKELASQREVTNSYKKKFEEISVENGLLSETITYKDEKIKRDAERLKRVRNLEADYTICKRNYQELDDLYKQSQQRADKILASVIQQKEKWLRKEGSYKCLLEELRTRKGINSCPDFLIEIFKFDSEIGILKKEIDDCKINEERLNEQIKDLKNNEERLKIFCILAEELIKCSSCESVSDSLILATPCSHMLCPKCYGGQCKECYSSITNSIHLDLAEKLFKLIGKQKLQNDKN